MKAVITTPYLLSDFILNWWTPIFVGIFLLIILYALWPRNKATFDQAARLPLRED